MKAVSFLAALLFASSAAFAAEDPKLSDPQVATIALTAHQIDADRGKIAAKKAKSDLVKQFAEQMSEDHARGVKDVLALAKKLGVKPEESAVTKSLKDGAAETNAKLEKLDGAAYDTAYIEAEIAYHEAVIDAVTNVLIPAAKNQEVKKALVNAGPLLQGHLTHAKMVQKQLAE